MARPITLTIVVLAAILCALPFALLYYLAFTPEGLAMIVARVPHRVGPVTLQIRDVRGTIAGGFDVAHFELTHARVHLVVEEAHAQLAIAPLLWQTIDVPVARARSVRIEVRARTTPPRKSTPRFLPRLLRINAGDASAGIVTLVAPHGEQVDFRAAHASGVVRHRSIRIFHASSEFQGMQVSANGILRAADPMRIDASGHAEWRAPEATQWVANFTGNGDLDRLAINGELTAPFRAEVTGAAETLTSHWKISGHARVSEFDLAAFGGGRALGNVDGAVDVTVDADGIMARGALTPHGLAAGPFDVAFDGKYTAHTLAIRRAEFRHQGSGARASAAGRIRIEAGGPWLDLSGRWNDFRWPLAGDAPAARSVQGQYRLRGEMPFALTASGTVQVAEFAAVHAALDGRLGGDRLDADSLRIDGYGGRADLRGAVAWQPREAWQLVGRVSGLDTGLIDARLPGRLGFDVDAGGEGFTPAGTANLAIARLTGELRGERAAGHGRIIRRGAQLTFEDVDLRAGAAHARLDGDFAPHRYALRFDLDADDLGLIDPEARGRLAARGTLGGSPDSPLIDATLHGEGIALRDTRVAGVDGHVRFSAVAGAPLDVHLRTQGLTIGARQVAAFTLTAAGTTERHDVRLSAASKPLAITARGTGSYRGRLWQLGISGLDLENGDEAALHLAEPSNFAWGPDLLQLETTCLRGAAATFCATGKRSPQEWALTLSAKGLPVSTFTAGLTPGVTYEGTVNFDAAAGATAGARWHGSLNAELRDARTRRRLANKREDVTELGGGTIVGSATDDGIVVDAKLDAGRSGGLLGHALVTRSGDAWRDWPLAGHVDLETDSLGFIAVLVAAIDRSAGRLAADIRLSGTLGAPRLGGTLSVRDGELDFYQVNLPLRAVTLDAQLEGNTLALDGSLTAGEGSARASGRLRWEDGLPHGVISLQGTNLRVVNVPEARMFASPDLTFSIGGRRIDVTGEVVVPNARLDPADLAGAVFASADERIVGERPVDASKQFVVTTNVKLVLGDRVTIDTYGLSGRLTGALVVNTRGEETARGTGELSIAEGKYVAFGRRLDIEHGKLIFNNGPIADPGIDIRASREFPDVTAGANVRGTLRSPRLTLFSEPQIPQSQILSLLIAGGSLESVQAQDANGATRRSNPFAIQGGAILAQQLGEYVGLEDISLESTLNNETSLVLGKYLTPRLYVSYGVSLTEAINTIKMRYTLGDNWTVKLESGAVQSADLEYTIEK
ncbi:MAG: translocation/assembly module TamB domain-containing protein [Steroidobacteraceae bacterium]